MKMNKVLNKKTIIIFAIIIVILVGVLLLKNTKSTKNTKENLKLKCEKTSVTDKISLNVILEIYEKDNNYILFEEINSTFDESLREYFQVAIDSWKGSLSEFEDVDGIECSLEEGSNFVKVTFRVDEETLKNNKKLFENYDDAELAIDINLPETKTSLESKGFVCESY